MTGGFLTNPKNSVERKLRDAVVKDWNEAFAKVIRKAPASRVRVALLEAEIVKLKRQIKSLTRRSIKNQ